MWPRRLSGRMEHGKAFEVDEADERVDSSRHVEKELLEGIFVLHLIILLPRNSIEKKLKIIIKNILENKGERKRKEKQYE